MFRTRVFTSALVLVLLAAVFAPTGVLADSPATQWRITVGAQSSNMATQVSTYFPNDITIDAGDSVTWTSATAEPHTVTFLGTRQAPPQDPFSPPTGGNAYSGEGYFNSGPLLASPAPGFAPSYSLKFTSPGTYTYICLFHPFMTGTVHF